MGGTRLELVTSCVERHWFSMTDLPLFLRIGTGAKTKPTLLCDKWVLVGNPVVRFLSYDGILADRDAI